MALRFQSGITNISHGGSTVVHNLTLGTPDEYFAAQHAATAPYFLGVSSTNVVLAAAVGGVSANVQVASNHTLIR